MPTRNITFAPTDFYSLKDLTPRVGVVYDLFGNGKTALKAHWGKYVGGLSAGTGNPVGNLSTNATRTWTDVNGNFNVDCDLLNVAAQDLTATGGDCCGANPNALFGLSTPSTAQDPDVYTGWGNRPWNQTFSVGVQHEVATRISVDVSYFRRWAGNFTVTDNRAVTSSDFTQYSVVAPSTFPGATIPLPDDAAGRTTNGFYDVNPNKVGQVSNLVTLARKFGDQYEKWQGVDITMNARLANGLTVQGGMATGKQVTDNCEIRAALPESTSRPTPDDYCHVEQGLQTQLKFLGTYLVPKIDVQFAATFQNNPGPNIPANYFVPAANIVGLGRPLTSGAPTVFYNLLVSEHAVRRARDAARPAHVEDLPHGHVARVAELRPGESAEPQRHPGRHEQLRRGVADADGDSRSAPVQAGRAVRLLIPILTHDAGSPGRLPAIPRGHDERHLASRERPCHPRVRRRLRVPCPRRTSSCHGTMPGRGPSNTWAYDVACRRCRIRSSIASRSTSPTATNWVESSSGKGSTAWRPAGIGIYNQPAASPPGPTAKTFFDALSSRRA